MCVGMDGSVGVAIPYGLDGLGIASRPAKHYATIQTGPGAQPAFCMTGIEGPFPGVKRLGGGVDTPPPP